MKTSKSQFNTGMIVCDEVQKRVIGELGRMGLGAKRIAALLNMSPIDVSKYLPEEDVLDRGGIVPQALLDKILYDLDKPVAVEVIVENEKQRYAEYSKLEKTSLSIMNSMLEFYHKQPVGIDLKQDAFVASLARDFIKVTHSARQELIQKYAIDKSTKTDDNTLRVEFV